MTRSDGVTFDDWFDNLQICILDFVGVDFYDTESVRQDYENDRNMYDVAQEIAIEYGYEP